jgi:thiol-disulfide isomerase/thioredoxin
MSTKRFTQAVCLLLFVFSLLLAGCSSNVQPASPTATPQPLTGKVSRAEVQAAAGWENLKAEDYSPDANLVKSIQGKTGDVKVLLFLGTWCPDSKREVPRFFKLMDQTGIPESQVEIIALDRTKKDKEGLTAKWDIQYVPTFIIVRGDKELGRIVETPQISLEANINTILSGG